MRTDTSTVARPPASPLWWILPAALFLISVAVTQPPFTGDSVIYVQQIDAVRDGSAPHQVLWEFGHILWRPIGYGLSGSFIALLPDTVAWTPRLKILSGLIMINLLAGLVGTLLIYAICLRFSGSRWAAIVCSILFVWGDAVLAYSQSGAPYIIGLALLLAGLWWQLDAREINPASIVGPACIFGLSVLLWFPFAVAIPAASCAGRFLQFPGSARRKMSWPECVLSATISAIVVFAGIGAAAWLAGSRSIPDVISWIVSSGHGMQQNRRLVRAVSGFSRLLIDLGPDGVYLKRFVLHDPYFPVSAIDVVRYSLWKVCIFYAFVASVLVLVWRSTGRIAFVPLAIAAVAGMFAAIVIFEPSSPERLLPVLPFFLIALSAGWTSSWRWAPALRVTIGAFAILLILLNLPSFEWQRSAEHRQAQTQLEEFRTHAKTQDLLLVMTMSEPIVRLALNPLDPLNHGGEIRTAWVLNPIDKDAADWRRTVARAILENWRSGNDIWITTAALSGRPNASSLWVEGDNPKVHWRDVPAFFNNLELDKTSDADSFARIRQSPPNIAMLSAE